MPLTRSTPQLQSKPRVAPWSSRPAFKPEKRSTPRHSAHFASSPLKRRRSPFGRLRSSHKSNLYDDSARNETTLINEHHQDADDPESVEQEAFDSDDSFFIWNEEKTLFSDLMGDNEREPDDEELAALAESLQVPFQEEGKILKKEIADTFVPAVNHVKELYKVLEERVDTTFGQGIVLFNRACKQIEDDAIREQRQLEDAYRGNQKRVEDLFNQLEQEYAYRDQLWVNIEKVIDEIGSFVTAFLCF
ncbi:uncharacterized protein LACBIDRAFT_305852 [Laccaria bicolor S238N-H82]|uniref:Predicted protein n=1 Tax=Laccaria bicolor (strain S238N-H82 / ATCC MYA-4686) TaxID=486041 RepID=B0CS31_LACBS|nr:uncharacterized protein LACBIDRAFT_305852 [Laccaria bicolor S238N-H82]EDR14783.1 predicted protein [Laccaria bicolor S238N-H82]|eukprot:XP_001875342.1 predicted protein [Laccaria bicolor S238N-H82]